MTAVDYTDSMLDKARANAGKMEGSDLFSENECGGADLRAGEF